MAVRSGGGRLVHLLALLVVLSLCLGALGACSQDTELAPPRTPRDSSETTDTQAATAVGALVTALRARDAAAIDRLAARGSELGALSANAAALDVDHLQARYLSQGPEPDAQTRLSFGADAFVGAVQWNYRLGLVDSQDTSVEVNAVFVPDGDRVRIASIGGYDDRSPLWLAGPVDVVRQGRATVIASADLPVAQRQRLAELAGRAVNQVHRVLRDWDGPLVVEAPGSKAGLDATLNASPGQYDDIAGVTTTPDGTVVPGSPVHVFLNPEIFATLKPKGAQVVMTHESTHVATGATFANLPEWLLEGFADYVALDHAGVPVQVAAGQILPQIRAKGLPSGLPTGADLQPTAPGLGATYEEAWLACRFLGGRYGEEKMIAFYRAVDRGTSLEQAFGTVLDTTQSAFVRAWRDDLARLAGVSR